MSLWLVLIIAGVLLALVGVFVPPVGFLVWIGGLAVVAGVVLGLVAGKRS